METAIQGIVIFALFLLSAFFSSSETALFSLTHIERRRIQEQHKFLGRYVQILLDNPSRTLVAILIGNNLVHILASAITSIMIINWLGEWGVGVAIASFTFFLVLFAEILPKAIAVKNNERLSLYIALPLHYFALICAPLRSFVRIVSDWTFSLVSHGKAGSSDKISDDELQALIEISHEEGVLEEDEARRLTRLFELGERSVKEIMTPRPDLVAFDIRKGREELVRLLKKYHYTHIPVYENTLDNIIGVAITQEAMLYPEKNIRDLLKAPYYVPETKWIDELLTEMKKDKVYCAVCVDEHGGTAGLVTQEDILEEIFGEMYDEYAKPENPFVKMGKDAYLVDGKILLKTFNELTNTQLDSEESETLSGLILERLGRIPKLKETIVIDSFVFQIRVLDKQRIAKVFARKVF